MKLNKARLKKLIKEQMEQPGSWQEAPGHDYEQKMQNLEAEIAMAKERFMGGFEGDPKRTAFRLAADLTAIERLANELEVDGSGEVPQPAGLEMLRALHTRMSRGDTVSRGDFTGLKHLGDPLGDRGEQLAYDDEDEDGWPSAVPAGRINPLQESKFKRTNNMKLTKRTLKQMIQEEMTALNELDGFPAMPWKDPDWGSLSAKEKTDRIRRYALEVEQLANRMEAGGRDLRHAGEEAAALPQPPRMPMPNIPELQEGKITMSQLKKLIREELDYTLDEIE